MKTFNDLDFKNSEGMMGGVQAMCYYSNGFCVSVIRSNFSYGGSEGLYELAVGEGDEEAWFLTYDTPVTSDVEGYLTPDDVTKLMRQVEGLDHGHGQANKGEIR